MKGVADRGDEMKELDRAQRIAVSGPLRKEALAAFVQQIKAWDMTMPPVEPLVLDFGLGDFYSIGLIEYWIANEIEAGYCAKYLFVFDGQTCPTHHHREKVETFFIVKGRVRMDCVGSVREMKMGDVLLVQTKQPHSFTGVGPALILEASTPCRVDDNYFADSRIPIGGHYSRKGL